MNVASAPCERLIGHSPSNDPGSPNVWGIREPLTGAIQYVCADPATGCTMLIDVVRSVGARATPAIGGADAVLSVAERENLRVDRVIDTHVPTEHVTASGWLRNCTGASNAIGVKAVPLAVEWQERHALGELPDPLAHFDALLEDGERFVLGEIEVDIWLMLGHTSDSIVLRAGDAAFVGDALAPPAVGTARADELGGDADELWASARSILDFEPRTRVFVGHDTGAPERKGIGWEASVREHREHNVHVSMSTTKAQFVERRRRLDAALTSSEKVIDIVRANLMAGSPPTDALA